MPLPYTCQTGAAGLLAADEYDESKLLFLESLLLCLQFERTSSNSPQITLPLRKSRTRHMAHLARHNTWIIVLLGALCVVTPSPLTCICRHSLPSPRSTKTGTPADFALALDLLCRLCPGPDDLWPVAGPLRKKAPSLCRTHAVYPLFCRLCHGPQPESLCHPALFRGAGWLRGAGRRHRHGSGLLSGKGERENLLSLVPHDRRLPRCLRQRSAAC